QAERHPPRRAVELAPHLPAVHVDEHLLGRARGAAETDDDVHLRVALAPGLIACVLADLARAAVVDSRRRGRDRYQNQRQPPSEVETLPWIKVGHVHVCSRTAQVATPMPRPTKKWWIDLSKCDLSPYWRGPGRYRTTVSARRAIRTDISARRFSEMARKLRF